MTVANCVVFAFNIQNQWSTAWHLETDRYFQVPPGAPTQRDVLNGLWGTRHLWLGSHRPSSSLVVALFDIAQLIKKPWVADNQDDFSKENLTESHTCYHLCNNCMIGYVSNWSTSFEWPRWSIDPLSEVRPNHPFGATEGDLRFQGQSCTKSPSYRANNLVWFIRQIFSNEFLFEAVINTRP